MWQDVTPSPGSRIVDALEAFRKADKVVREAVIAELLGCETPEIYDRAERAAIRQGKGSYDDLRLDMINRNVGSILQNLRRAGVIAGESTESVPS